MRANDCFLALDLQPIALDHGVLEEATDMARKYAHRLRGGQRRSAELKRAGEVRLAFALAMSRRNFMRCNFAMRLKEALRRGINRAGFDVIRLHRSPKRTLLGLDGLDIGAVIDVGANRGQFARFISGFFPHAQLYCFEPLPDPFGQLSAWARTQNGRVHCFQVALGDQEGQVEMHLHEQHTPSSSLLTATDTCHRLYPQTRAERMVSVRISTLDRELGDVVERLPPGVLLKLDVQGFEDRVLRGAERVLGKCKAVVLEVSVDPLYEGQADFFGLAGLLQESGFRYAGNLDQSYGEDGHVVFLDAVFVRS